MDLFENEDSFNHIHYINIHYKLIYHMLKYGHNFLKSPYMALIKIF